MKIKLRFNFPPSISNTQFHPFLSLPLIKKNRLILHVEDKLRLCFALTVHKAQGLSLDRLAVDCKSLNHNGQLYVALCPAAYKKGLQVTNFYKTLLKRPTETLIDFYLLPKKYPQQNQLLQVALYCTIWYNL